MGPTRMHLSKPVVAAVSGYRMAGRLGMAPWRDLRVAADEALRMGLANRVVPAGEAVSRARELAEQLAGLPGTCLRGDRLSVPEQWGMEESEAILHEFEPGERALSSGETVRGAPRFRDGQGRHGGSD